MHESLHLPGDPAAALRLLRESSNEATVLVFKKSPVCPVSSRAAGELQRWLEGRSGGASLSVAEVDVIAERGLARGLTAELGIEHESPQVLLFRQGELRWHGSHNDLTAERFAAEVDEER